MNRKTYRSSVTTAVVLLLISTFLYPQTAAINAGSYQIIDWEKTHSA